MPPRRFHRNAAASIAALVVITLSISVASESNFSRPDAARRSPSQTHWEDVRDADPFLFVIERELAPHSRFRIICVSEKPLQDTRLEGSVSVSLEIQRHVHGPPYARLFELEAPREPGVYPIHLFDSKHALLASTEVTVRTPIENGNTLRPEKGVWRTRRAWNPAWERVFSAWVALLFRPLEESKKGWRPLHQVLRDPVRNFLYNRLNYGEDDPESLVPIRARADCGDLPYHLRAYFAWKLGLPFRFRLCDRGSGSRGPRCRSHRDNQMAAFDHIPHPVARFNALLEKGIAWRVHSGTLRTLPEDENSDFYPIALRRESIRPGTVFVDVGGHILMVTRWSEDGLFAVDGHPDKTVTIRSFSPRFFRYYHRVRTGGFKAFRPLESRDGKIVPTANSALDSFFSTEQYQFSSKRAFYDLMTRLIEAKK